MSKTIKSLSKAVALCGLCLVLGTLGTAYYSLTGRSAKARQLWIEMVAFVTDSEGELSTACGE